MYPINQEGLESNEFGLVTVDHLQRKGRISVAVVESWDIRNLHVGQRFRKRCCFMFTGEFGGIFLEHSDVEVCHSFAVALPSILIFNSGVFLINFNLGGVFLIKSHFISLFYFKKF